MVIGSGVVVAPRDSTAPVCLDKEDGDLLWRLAGVPFDAIVGVHARVIIFKGRRSLVGVDGVSGRAVWEQTFEETIRGQAVLAGGVVYVGTDSQLVACAARTGTRLASRSWPGFDAFLVRGDAIVGTTWEQAAGGSPGQR